MHRPVGTIRLHPCVTSDELASNSAAHVDQFSRLNGERRIGGVNDSVRQRPSKDASGAGTELSHLRAGLWRSGDNDNADDHSGRYDRTSRNQAAVSTIWLLLIWRFHGSPLIC